MYNGKYQCHYMAASCTYHQVLSPSCSTRAIQKSLKNVSAFFGEKSQGNGPLAEKWPDRKSKKTILHRNASNNIDRKEESNEIGKRIKWQLSNYSFHSSVQFKMVSMCSEKPIRTLSHLSEGSPMWPLKRFQCSSDSWWPSLILSRKIV